jgi:gentisate 1,2-dioxygenase
VLLCVTNEPELSYQGLSAPAPERNPVRPVFFEGGKIDETLEAITDPLKTAGRAIILTAPHMLATKAMIPSLSIAVNTLEPGCNQRPHRHNATALTLAIGWQGVHTNIDGEEFPWSPFCVLLTPPRAVHSHHNLGEGLMKALVFQDGGLYYQFRNVGFNFEQPVSGAQATA